jgi:hypothetical protein
MQIKVYDAVMFPDDDLLMSSDDLNLAFAIFYLYNLELGQLSLCKCANDDRQMVGWNAAA